MLKTFKSSFGFSRTLLVCIKIQSFPLCTTTPLGKNDDTEWENLLKPYDLKHLQRSLNPITPSQLCKLLELPLDVPTSMDLFEKAGLQRGYIHSFHVYYLLIDKLGNVGEFKMIDKLLKQMKDERLCF